MRDRPSTKQRTWPWAALVLLGSAVQVQGEDAPLGLTERIPWSNTRLVGSPDPPLPYSTERIYESVKWDRPIYAKSEPGTENLVVVQQGGEEEKPTKLIRLLEAEPPRTSTLLEIEQRLVYGLTFHPDYESNGFIYIFSNGPTGQTERQNRISRFTVPRGADQCDPASELTIIQWRSMGHDGGELAFGPDGMLFISSGDGTSDSDTWLSAQDVSNLLGGVLRIDVSQSSQEDPYTIPPDNPFVELEGARGELWAFGLRNPWRLWCDQASGQIWVGNNGQDLWETAHLIRRGENYGWSVYEGSHPFYAHRQRGPAPIVAPTVEHHHTEARSLTGGVVYRGDRLPELDGAYIYGDYSTGRIWGVRHDGTRVTWHEELADTIHQIAGFAISPAGELIVVDHGGGLFRLRKSPPVRDVRPFPQRLSDTGLFVSVMDHVLKPGIVPYSVNAPAWNDGATAQRFLAVPADGKIGFTANRGWNLPNDTVALQTLSIGDEDVARRIETRLLIRQQNEWTGYSYRWNARQDDATLVSKQGEDIRLTWKEADGTPREQAWRIPSRAECMSCHSRAVNFVLGLSSQQLNRNHLYGQVIDNQLRSFHHIGLFENELPEEKGQALVNPYEKTKDLSRRARSYLHTNCSSCHVEAGGGNARMQLESTKDLEALQVVLARPQHATFQIDNAMLVAPGEPERSVLLQRVSRRGPGQMPPLVSRQVDDDAVALIREWIASMEPDQQPFVRAWRVDDVKLNGLSGKRSPESGKETFTKLGCNQCHRFAGQGGGAGPDLTDIAKRLAPPEILRSITDPSAQIALDFAMTSILTVDGTTILGRIEQENESEIRVRSQESFDHPITISKTNIEARTLSKKSMMPSGMLNVCTEEQILDLLAYLMDGASVKQTD